MEALLIACLFGTIVYMICDNLKKPKDPEKEWESVKMDYCPVCKKETVFTIFDDGTQECLNCEAERIFSKRSIL